MIRRDKEIDVAAGDARIVILIHEKGGKNFLWPVLRQRPSDTNITGILGGWKGWICLYDFRSDQCVKSVFAPSCAGWWRNNSLKDTIFWCCVPLSVSFLASLLHGLSSLHPVLKPEVYEEVQQTPTTQLKINNQEIDVTRYILFCIISW